MNGITAGFAVCGSFCTIAQATAQIRVLLDLGVRVVPIFSPIVYRTDTRFGKAADLIARVTAECGRPVLHEIPEVEPIGPRNLLDILVVAPCTGNTLGKLACGVTDTCVTLAVKAHLRNGKPVVLAIATNDALGASGKNIGLLANTQNIYFVPFGQDDPTGKQKSLVADFTRIPDVMRAALEGRQYQPMLL